MRVLGKKLRVENESSEEKDGNENETLEFSRIRVC